MDPRKMYERALDQTAEIIRAVRPDQLDDPTPCGDFDVRKLLSHLVGVVNRAAHVGEGGVAMEVPAFADDVPDDGFPVAFDAAVKRALAAWADDSRLDAICSVPWGDVPGRGALAGYTQETVMHGWDLAKATGQETERDPELGEMVLGIAQRVLPEEPREGVPFGPVQPVPDGAGVYARLAGWLGRTP